jgi:outer membrane protein
MIYRSKLKNLKKQHNLIIASVALLLASTTSNALAYTLDDALVSAHENNYKILSQFESLESNKIDKVKAYTGFLPTIQAGIASTKTDLKNPLARADQKAAQAAGRAKDKVNTKSLVVSQPIFKGGETFANIKIAESSLESGQSAFKAVSNEISLETIKAYEEILRAKDIHEYSISNEKVFAENLKLIKTKFKHGEVTKTDVLQSESRYSSAIAERERAYGDLKSAEATFVRVVGSELPESLDPVVLDNVVLPETFDELLDIALKNNPSLLARKYSAEAAKHSVTRSYSVVMPKVSAKAEFDRTDIPKSSRTNTSDSNTYTLNLAIPIFQSGSEYADIFKAQHAAKKEDYDYKEIERQVRENAVKTWNNYKVSQAVIKSSDEAIQAQEKALAGVREEAKAGTRTTLDVLNEQQVLFSTKVRKRNANKDLVESAYSILQLMGALNIVDIISVDPK